MTEPNQQLQNIAAVLGFELLQVAEFMNLFYQLIDVIVMLLFLAGQVSRQLRHLVVSRLSPSTCGIA